jgi:putative membrane protein
MYGGFFLGSVWDPYGKTADLPVVVVNDDNGAQLNGEKINIGNDVVAELKKDNNLEWHFESSKQASEDMQANKYYMMVVLPDDFSKNAASITSSSPRQSILKYTVAASKNYIGTVVDKEAVTTLKNNVSSTISRGYVRAILANISKLTTGMDQAASGSGEITAGAETALSGTKLLVNALRQYTSGVGGVAYGQASLNSGLKQLELGSKQLQAAVVTINTSMPSATDISTLKTGLNTIAVGLAQLDETLSKGGDYSVLSGDITSIGTNLHDIGSAVTNQSSELTTLSGLVAGSSASSAEKAAMMNSINSLSGYVSDEGAEVAAAGNTLSGSSSSSVVNQLKSIEDQAKQLQASVKQLDGGMAQANGGAQKALDGLSALRVGASQLVSGANSLAGNMSTAASGGNQLLAGVNELNVSSAALNGGAVSIQDGMSQLVTGSATLMSQLKIASDQLKMQPVNDKTADQIANPVTTKESAQGNVPNYGHALAPYVLSLGLFVGALVFNFIYPIRKVFGDIASGIGWWFAKFSVGFIVAILQAAVLSFIMIVCLGLKPDYLAAFLLSTAVTSCAYMAIVMFLSMTFNNPGRFVAMVLLVLQLGGSGGTFPLQLSNGFFQAISPYLPMTYSILSLRWAISSGLGSGVYWSSLAVLFGLFVVFNALIILVLTLRHQHGFKPDEA